MVLRRGGASHRTPSLLHGTDGLTVTTGRPVSGHHRLVLWPDRNGIRPTGPKPVD